MADPIIPGVYRAISILQGTSDLPEDRFVNTWGFRAVDGNIVVDAAAIADALETFYGSLSDLYSTPYITPGLEVRVYDLSTGPPRVPTIEQRTFTPAGTGVYPNEVAVVLSFYSLVNQPRHRGRIYIGPLASIGNSGASGPVSDLEVPGTVRTQIGNAAVALADDTATDWAIISGADAIARDVSDGWVDDAFDTQRSRGATATARTTWSAS